MVCWFYCIVLYHSQMWRHVINCFRTLTHIFNWIRPLLYFLTHLNWQSFIYLSPILSLGLIHKRKYHQCLQISSKYQTQIKNQVSVFSKFHNNTLQTSPWHNKEEPQNTNSYNFSITFSFLTLWLTVKAFYYIAIDKGKQEFIFSLS